MAGTGGALLINAWWEPLTFVLPAGGAWTVELDTAQPADGRQASSAIEVVARSLVLLSAPR